MNIPGFRDIVGAHYQDALDLFVKLNVEIGNISYSSLSADVATNEELEDFTTRKRRRVDWNWKELSQIDQENTCIISLKKDNYSILLLRVSIKEFELTQDLKYPCLTLTYIEKYDQSGLIKSKWVTKFAITGLLATHEFLCKANSELPLFKQSILGTQNRLWIGIENPISALVNHYADELLHLRRTLPDNSENFNFEHIMLGYHPNNIEYQMFGHGIL